MMPYREVTRSLSMRVPPISGVYQVHICLATPDRVDDRLALMKWAVVTSTFFFLVYKFRKIAQYDSKLKLKVGWLDDL